MTKQETAIATTPKLTALTCPNRQQHKNLLGLICPQCEERLPANGINSEEVTRYFFVDAPQPPAPHPVFADPRMVELTARVAELWAEHEKARLAYTAALFEAEDLKRGRADARGKDADPALGPHLEARIAAARERAEVLREGTRQICREINRIDQIRKGMHQRAVWVESYPVGDSPGTIAARIAQLLKGATTT